MSCRARAVALFALALNVSVAEAQNAPPALPMLGLHYGIPLKFSAGLGVIWPTNDGFGLGVVDAGAGGARFGVGHFWMARHKGSMRTFILRASVMRTSRRAWHAPANVTWLGPEAQWNPLMVVGIRAGLFVPVSRSGGAGPMGTGGISFGI